MSQTRRRKSPSQSMTGGKDSGTPTYAALRGDDSKTMGAAGGTITSLPPPELAVGGDDGGTTPPPTTASGSPFSVAPEPPKHWDHHSDATHDDAKCEVCVYGRELGQWVGEDPACRQGRSCFCPCRCSWHGCGMKCGRSYCWMEGRGCKTWHWKLFALIVFFIAVFIITFALRGGGRKQ